MMDNDRHEPGSTRCGLALSGSATYARRFQAVPEKSVQNPYKYDHLREREFGITSASTTYNVSALKCTDFLASSRLCVLALIPSFAAATNLPALY